MIRPPRMTRRRWLIFVLLASLGVAGLVAWGRRDPWPARLVIPTPLNPAWTWFTGDGRTFFALGPEPAYWDLVAGRQVGPTALDSNIRWLAHAPDGRSCLGYRPGHPADPDSTATISWIDAATGAVKLRLPTRITTDLACAAAFADDGRSIRAVFLKTDGTLEAVTWDVATGRAVATSTTPPRDRGLRGCSAALGLGAYGDQGVGGIRLWDLATGQPTGDFLRAPGLPFDPRAMPLFAPDGRTLVVAHLDGLTEFWDVPARRLLRSIKLHRGELPPDGWEFAPDGRTILAQVDEPTAAPSRLDPAWRFVEDHLGDWFPEWFEPRHEAVVVDLATGRRLARLRSTTYLGEFSPDGRWIIGEEPDGKLSVRAAPQPPAP